MFAHIWWFVEISESAFTTAIIPHISEYHGYHGYHGWLVGIQIIKGSLGGETSVLRTFRMSGKELVKERVSKES